uniref:Uncharacterized protein n=1 Tax=Romanomermis culicivorax TaxID=13658 RepID=A0A915HTE0_ROMCU
MRFNISLEAGHFAPSILNVTVQLNEKKAIVEQPRVNQTIIGQSPIVLRVKPWLIGDALRCAIATDFQTFFLYEEKLGHELKFH